MEIQNSKIALSRWKKGILLVIGMIFILRIGFIGIRGEVDRTYFTSGEYDISESVSIPCTNISQTFSTNQDRLNSLEFYFVNIAEDKAGAVTVCIYSGDVLIYQAKITLENVNNYEWKKIFVNAEMHGETVYRITLNADEECTQIPEVLAVKKNNAAASEIIASYADNVYINGDIAIKYGYMQFPHLIDRLVMISLWILLYGIIFIVLIYFERITRCLSEAVRLIVAQFGLKAFIYIAEMLGCLLILNCSGIEFQELTKILFYAVSITAATNFSRKFEYIKRIAENRWKKILLACLYMYAAFALVGQRILIYPLTLNVTSEGLFVYISTVIWFIPVVNSLLYYLNIAERFVFRKCGKFNSWQFSVIVIMILTIPAFYNLIANNPGISTGDTLACMIWGAQSLHGTFDWHPAFYCMVLRAIQNVWNSTYAVIAVQYFFWIYVMTEFLLFLRKKGMSDFALIFVALFCGLNAGNFMHLNTIWKDIPYTLSLLWAFIIIGKLCVDFEEYKHKYYIYLELIVALTGVFFYRKNGVVSFIVIAAVLFLVLRKNARLMISLISSIVLIGMIKGPVYSYFDIQSSGKYGMYIGLGQDILGVYYSGGEVSENTLQMINMMTNYNNAEYDYTPTCSRQSYEVDVEISTFIINYIDTFLKNPVLMTRAVIDREDALWDIYMGQDSILGCVNCTDTADGQLNWNDYYSPRAYVSLSTKMSEATAYTASSQWLAAIEWRAGLFCLLGLISLVFLIIRFGFKKYLVIAAPAFGHILSLLLSTGWSDYRYFWPLNLMNLGIILFSILIIKLEKGQEENRV